MFWPRQNLPPPDPIRNPTGQDPTRPAPFVLERRFEDVRSGGTFTPTAAVWITPALHQSGLLSDLAPEDLRLLLAVLSSVSGNGTFVATPELLAPILGLSTAATRARLERLRALKWKGGALLSGYAQASGLHFFSPSAHLLGERHSVICPAPGGAGPLEVPEHATPGGQPERIGGSRDRIIAHSRAAYARPRAEVEADINHFLSPQWQQPRPGLDSGLVGKDITETEEAELSIQPAATPEAREWLRLKRLLVGLGVPHHKAEALLESHPAENIDRQLAWLPYRHARNPAAYLVAAIGGDYAAPPGISLQPENEPPEAGDSSAAREAETVATEATTAQERTGEAIGPVAIEVQGIEALQSGKETDEAS